jgi:molybdopterin converting factor small subunit
MPVVTVRLPTLLAGMAAGASTVRVEADTLAGVLDALVRAHPSLRVHLFDESGGLRRHVLCFHNQTNTRWLPRLDVPVAAGDVVSVIQAVSGG